MLAIMPPPVIAEEIQKVRLAFADKYKAYAALKPPVHITLVPPFWALKETEERLIRLLDAWAATQKPFQLRLNGFDTFRRNGVIFINVEENRELYTFQKNVMQRYMEIFPAQPPGVGFHPHLTIGYRDIPKEVFKEAAKEYLQRRFEASFEIKSFYLWKHNRKSWLTHHTFSLLR